MPNVFFSNTTPAASAGHTLVTFATASNNVSASVPTALLAANNLSDLTNVSAALTALGGASLTTANTFSGVQTFAAAATLNLNSSSIVLGGGLITGTATMGGNLNIVNGQYISGSGSIFFTTTNATSWQEFRLLDSAGGTAPADALLFQYNTRSASGGTDSWLTALSVSAQTGVATFTNSVAIAGGTARQQLSVGSGLDLYTNSASQSPTVPSIRGGVAALVINCMPTGAIFFNYDTGAGCPTNFCNGSGGVTASISSGGAASFAGVASSAAITGQLGGWIAWTPTVTGGGSMSAGAPTAVTAYYLLVGPLCFIRCRFTTVLSGIMNLTLSITNPPVAEKLGSPVFLSANVGIASFNASISGSTIAVIPSSGTGTFTTGSNVITVNGAYQWA